MRLMPSLRLRLLIILLATFAVSWSLIAIATFTGARNQVEELFDAQLAQYARTLQGLTSHELKVGDHLGISLEGTAFNQKYAKKIAFQIWSGSDLVVRSTDAPEHPLSRLPGFHDVQLGHHRWRVFVLERDHAMPQVQVAERYDVRNGVVHEISAQVLYPLILALPPLVLMIWFGVAGGLRPLRRVASMVAGISPRRIEPLSDDVAVPKEVQPLVGALNTLLARLQHALDNERRFTADAAHELRTPLAGLKMQAQVALNAKTTFERRRALQQLIRGVDHATYLVGQMLTLARFDPETTRELAMAVDLPGVVTKTLAELVPAAMAKGIDLGLSETVPMTVRGFHEAIGILVRNLVDNAIKYTPQGGRVDVAIVAGEDGAVLTVTDTGPGVPAAVRGRLFDRFYRAPGQQVFGAGLGLSIVRRIADLHGAIVDVDADYGAGLRTRVRFPC